MEVRQRGSWREEYEWNELKGWGWGSGCGTGGRGSNSKKRPSRYEFMSLRVMSHTVSANRILRD